MKILIKDILQKTVAKTTKDGLVVFEEIKNILDNPSFDTLIIDFKDIEKIQTTFLNAAIGQLYGILPSQEIDKKVKYENFPKDRLIRLDEVKENAISYYKNKQAIEDLTQE